MRSESKSAVVCVVCLTLLLSFVSQLSKMRPEEYRSIIKRLETHYQEFQRNSQGSELFGEEDRKVIQGHFDQAQNHYDTLIVQLPTFSECKMSMRFSYAINSLNW